MRIPSVHIKLPDLEKVLADLGYPKALAQKILEKSFRYRCHRYMLKADINSLRKAKKLEKSTVSLEWFSGLLAQERMQAHHKGIKPIRAGSNEYNLLRDIATLSQDFVDAYGFDREEGHRTYIRLGIQAMGRKYALNRFKTYNEKICQVYEATYSLAKDEDKEGTEAFHQHWVHAMQEYAGLTDSLADNVVSYVNMLYGRMDADECDAYYSDWVAAQFEGLAFLDVIPNPSQFFGEAAKTRYKDYARQKALKKQKRDGKGHVDIDVKKFKQSREI
jgi:hypothetical protein